MAVAFKAVSATANSTTGNFSFVQPSGVVSGDLIIAFVACKGDSFTFPTGWTTILSVAGSGTNGGLRIAYIIRGASAPALTVSGRASADVCFYFTAAFTGHATTTPVVLLASATNTSPVNTTGTVSGISPDDMIVLAFGGADNVAFASYTDSSAQITTWTERTDAGTANGSNTRAAIATGPVPAGTLDPYGPFSGTGGGAASSTIGVLQIVQAATGGTTNVSLTPSAVGTNALSKRVSTAKAATAAGVASLKRDFSKALAYVASGVNTLLKRVAKPLAASAAGVSTLARLTVKLISFAYSAVGSSSFLAIRAILRSFAMTATGTSSLLKSVRKTIANAVTGVSTLIKQIKMPRAFTATGVVALNDLLVRLISFAISAVGTVTFISKKVFIANYGYAATGVNTLAKRIAKTLTATALGLSNVLKEVRLPRAISALGTAAFSFRSVATRTFSAVAVGIVTFAKIFIGGFAGPAQKVYKRSKFIMNNFGRW
jgi:hypothetical protein